MIEMILGAILFSLGVIAGWVQRNADRERDAQQLAEAIISQYGKPFVHLEDLELPIKELTDEK